MYDDTNPTTATAPVAIDTAKIETKSQLGQALVTLAQARERWTVGSYAASNLELYVILGATLDLLYRVKRNTEMARGLNELLKKYGFTYTDATSTEVKLLRAVFADPTKPDQYTQRIYVYARVLSVAHADGITGDQLAAYITKHGGIDEIRRNDPKAVSKADKEKLAVHTAEKALTISSVKVIAAGFTLTADLQPADGEHFSLALVRKEKDGTGAIVFGTNNAALVRTVLGIAGRKIEGDEDAAREHRRAAEHKSVRETDLAAFTDAVAANNGQANATAPKLVTAAVPEEEFA